MTDSTNSSHTDQPKDWASFDPKTKVIRVVECSKRYVRYESQDIYCIAKADLIPIDREDLIPSEDIIQVVPYEHRYDTTVAYFASKKNMILTDRLTDAQTFFNAVDDEQYKIAFYLLCVLDDETFTSEFNAYGDTLVQCSAKSPELLEAVLRKVDTDAVLLCGNNKANVLHTIAKCGDTESLHILIAIRPDLMDTLANMRDSHDRLPIHDAEYISDELTEILFMYTD